MIGKRPIAEIQFADFILPAVNQIISEAAKMRYRSNNDWQCPITIRAPFGGGVHGGLYHSQSIESIFASTPGLTIVIPSSLMMLGLLLSSIESNDPVLFFEHKSISLLERRSARRLLYSSFGKADVKREGKDITVFTYGLCVNYCMQAADILAADGISVEIVDLRTVYPLDKETIIERAKMNGKILLITEDNLEAVSCQKSLLL